MHVENLNFSVKLKFFSKFFTKMAIFSPLSTVKTKIHIFFIPSPNRLFRGGGGMGKNDLNKIKSTVTLPFFTVLA